MKAIIFMLLVLFIASCSGNDPKRDSVKRDLVVVKLQEAYIAELEKCTPIKTEKCRISAGDTLKIEKGFNTYLLLRNGCWSDGDCNVCSMMESLKEISSALHRTPTVDFTPLCNSGSELDFNDLQTMEFEENA